MLKTKKNFWIDRPNAQKAINLAVSYTPYMVMLAMGGMPAAVGSVALAFSAFKCLRKKRLSHYWGDIERFSKPSPSAQMAFNRIKNSMGIKEDISLGISFLSEESHSTRNYVVLESAFMLECGVKEAEYVMAHELSHIKNKDCDYKLRDRIPRDAANTALFSSFLASYVAVAYDMVTTGGLHTMTKMMASVVGLAIANRFAQPVLRKAFKRIQEFRADKDAICITKDVMAAERVLREPDMHPLPTSLPQQRLRQFFSTHPYGDLRVRRMETVLKRQERKPTP